jgi:hypothetical protein
MATAEDALRARLGAVSAVTALLGSPLRVYPVKKDQGATPVFPYVTYEQILGQRISAMVADTGDVESEFRFHIWTRTAGAVDGHAQGRDIAVAIRGALKRWEGTSAGVLVKHVFETGEFDIGDDEPGIYHRVIDFDVRWTE